MRHLKRGRKLGRTSSHRTAMLRNMATSLFVHGRIVTTPAKAKEARPFAEKLITLAKNGTLAARRRALAELHDARVVRSLFGELGPRYRERPGGYTRILHMPGYRVGDGSPKVLFELVEAEIKWKKGAPPAPKETPKVGALVDSGGMSAGEKPEAAPDEDKDGSAPKDDASPSEASAETAVSEEAPKGKCEPGDSALSPPEASPASDAAAETPPNEASSAEAPSAETPVAEATEADAPGVAGKEFGKVQ